jgi:pimeloyl-ACP methyl ester carboxylesterase
MTADTPRSGTLAVNGARLAYELAGAGAPLVLLHAGIADSRMWGAQFDQFAQRRRTLRYDARGYGRSEMPAGPFARHQDLAELLRQLGVARAAVVGASMGGATALDFALEHPEMVEALVLVASGLSGYQFSEAFRRYEQEEEAALERGDLDTVVEINLRMWVDGPTRPPEAVHHELRSAVARMIRDASTSTEGVPRRPSLPAVERLGEIRAPTLVLIGDLDVPDMLAIADLLVAGIPSARKATIEGAAHLPSMERPEEFTRLVLDFLADTAGTTTDR